MIDNTILSNQCGILQVFYDNESKKLKKFSFSKENEAIDFDLTSIWVNQQPASCIKKFERQIIRTDDLMYYEIIEKELHLRLKTQQTLCLKIVINKHAHKFYEASPNLQVSGLKKMIQREFHWMNFEIKDSKGFSFETTSKLIKCAGLKDNPTLFIKNVEDPLLKVNRENEGRGSSSESSNRFLKFVNFQNEFSLFHEQQKPGLNLIGKCENKECNLKGKIQCVNKGFSKDKPIDIKEEFITTKCPGKTQANSTCGSKFINNCSLLNCTFQIVNGKTMEGSPISGVVKQVAKLGIGLSFDSSNDNIIEWKTLEMDVNPLPLLQKEVVRGFSVKETIGAGLFFAILVLGTSYCMKEKK